ncbi:MAG TPA: hypothetical protein VK914_09620 [bacterium]|nr:hypothetical protein [bacterium]
MAGSAAKPSLGRRVRWEKDKLGRILVFDCSNNSLEEAYALFHAFQDAVLSQPEGSVRVLADLENGSHDIALTRMWKEAIPSHDRIVTKLALLRVTGSMKVVIAAYRFYARVRGVEVDLKMAYFEDETKAREWLAEL